MALVRLEMGDPGNGVARLVLDRPDQRNAVSAAMVEELLDALRALAADPSIRAVILSGEGRDFCAGADIAELAGVAATPAEYGRALEEALIAIQDHPVPVIAQIHGAALGAGCQLAVACDLAVAADDARLGIPSARLGIVINAENIARLVLAVGRKRAGELLYASRELTGAEAASWGLVNAAVPAAALAERAHALAGMVAVAAPLSVRASKVGIARVMEGMALDRGRDDLAEFDRMTADVLGSEDLVEGIRAFLERRAPRFGGS